MNEESFWLNRLIESSSEGALSGSDECESVFAQAALEDPASIEGKPTGNVSRLDCRGDCGEEESEGCGLKFASFRRYGVAA